MAIDAASLVSLIGHVRTCGCDVSGWSLRGFGGVLEAAWLA